MKALFTLFLLLCLFNIYSIRAEELPADLRILNEQRAAKIRQIDETYRTALINLQSKYTKAGDLQTANLIQELIDDHTSPTDSNSEPVKLPKSADDLSKFLVGSSWGSGDKKVSEGMIFHSNGEFKSKKVTCRYVVTGPKTVTVIWNPTTSIKCEFIEDFSLLRELEGVRNVFKFLGRVKTDK